MNFRFKGENFVNLKQKLWVIKNAALAMVCALAILCIIVLLVHYSISLLQ